MRTVNYPGATQPCDFAIKRGGSALCTKRGHIVNSAAVEQQVEPLWGEWERGETAAIFICSWLLGRRVLLVMAMVLPIIIVIHVEQKVQEAFVVWLRAAPSTPTGITINIRRSSTYCQYMLFGVFWQCCRHVFCIPRLPLNVLFVSTGK